MRKGGEAFQEKLPITLNDVINFYWQISSNLQQKENLVSLQVQTAYFGIGENPKQSRVSFKKKTAQNLACIKKKPLSIIIILLMLYLGVIRLMIDVRPITPWELFKALCTGMAVAEFNDVLF